jgi:sugar phosphate isomerase/epimerase
MWPGLVGKEEPNVERVIELVDAANADNYAETLKEIRSSVDRPPISLEHMLDLSAAAQVDGQSYDGIDYFLFLPHTNPEASDDELNSIADMIASKGFDVGSLVAPVWPGTVGDSAMGDTEATDKFLDAVRMACRVAGVFNKHGVRKRGVIRIDSAEFGLEQWRENPKANTTKIANTFREAAKIAADHGERLAAEGEICWAGMHSWKDMLDLLEEVGMPESLGFQADMAHTYLYLMGYNAPEHALLQEGYTEDEFYAAYEQMVSKLRPWTIDFHIAQNDGTVHGVGTHDKTGKHCPADDPNGKLDIVKCAGYWLEGAQERGIEHICWDGCMFPNEMLETEDTWNTILKAMSDVRDTHGWN